MVQVFVFLVVLNTVGSPSHILVIMTEMIQEDSLNLASIFDYVFTNILLVEGNHMSKENTSGIGMYMPTSSGEISKPKLKGSSS